MKYRRGALDALDFACIGTDCIDTIFKASTVCCEENRHCTDLNDVDKLNMYMYQHNLISEIIFELSESTEQCLDFSGLR